MRGKKAIDWYPLDERFAELVAYHLATQARFFGSLGGVFEPDLIRPAAARLLAQAAVGLHRRGAASRSILTAVQELVSWRDLGRVTTSQLDDVDDLIARVEGDPAARDVDAVLGVIGPILRRRAVTAAAMEATKAVVEAGHDDAEATKTAAKVAQRCAQVAAIGRDVAQGGISLRADEGDEAFLREALADLEATVREPLPVGHAELDDMLGGGLGRGKLGMVMGGQKTGKSFFLVHLATTAMLVGKRVAFATLELDAPTVRGRIRQSWLGLTAAEMKSSELVLRRKHAWAGSKIAAPRVCFFGADAGTVEDLREWLRRLDQEDASPEVLVVDYADLMTARGHEDESSYQIAKLVWRGLRDMAVDRQMYVWTASQLKGDRVRKREIDAVDQADSQHKTRICDVAVGLGGTLEDVRAGNVTYSVSCNRTGAGGGTLPPAPHDFARCRIIPMFRHPREREAWS